MDEKYFDRLRQIIFRHIDSRRNRAFVFGSSLRGGKFFDVDIALTGELEGKIINRLRDELEESTFPFKVDLVNFEQADPEFKKQVLTNSIKWLN